MVVVGGVGGGGGGGGGGGVVGVVVVVVALPGKRVAVVAALESVDAVTWFDEDTPLALIERLRREVLIEVRSASGTGTAAYLYVITDLGRDRARQYMGTNSYVGPAPVPLTAHVVPPTVA